MDNEEDPKILCPHCDEVMKKIPISTRSGCVTIDKCDKCNGYWFDGTELEKLVIDDNDSAGFLLDPSEVHEANFHCPRCSWMMETKLLYDIKVDICVRCNGIWLDSGELADIQERYRAMGNEDVILDIIDGLIAEVNALKQC